ncbi:MAG: M48 family metalloprotease [Veillonella sp.]|nr:M48 family metalloprotease [Veillonella sp.]
MNNMKTTLLLATLTAILVVLGDMIGGRSGMMIMFVISMGMNFMSYWFSDKIVLAQYNAQQVTAQSNPKLYGMVERLAKNGKLPMPKVYIIPSDVPNAFATGRNPSHAAVAVTESNPLALIGAIIIAPIAAGLIQMSISRAREFLADEGGGEMCRNPLALASALAKIDYYSKHGALPNASNATAHMFIINPMVGIGESLSNLFSTHPRTEERIAKLKQQAMNPKYKEKALF